MSTRFCTNKKLVAYFLKHGVKPIDITLGFNDTLMFKYDTAESNPVYEQWLGDKNEEEDENMSPISWKPI